MTHQRPAGRASSWAAHARVAGDVATARLACQLTPGRRSSSTSSSNAQGRDAASCCPQARRTPPPPALTPRATSTSGAPTSGDSWAWARRPPTPPTRRRLRQQRPPGQASRWPRTSCASRGPPPRRPHCGSWCRGCRRGCWRRWRAWGSRRAGAPRRRRGKVGTAAASSPPARAARRRRRRRRLPRCTCTGARAVAALRPSVPPQLSCRLFGLGGA